MQPRMQHPVAVLPDAMKGLHAFHKAAAGLIPSTTQELVSLRASQINGCSVCVEGHSKTLKKNGEPEEKIWAVAAWRDTPYFTDEERAALELTEALTRLADNHDPVSDELWAQVSKYYDEEALSALLLDIAGINVWNRLNAATRQQAGVWQP